jgi:hypothetical protein
MRRRNSYLEAAGRLLAGMALWLTLPEDQTEEGQLRRRFHEQALLHRDRINGSFLPESNTGIYKYD